MSKKLVICTKAGHPSDGYVAIPGQIYMVTDVDHDMQEYEISRPGWETWDRSVEPMDNFEVITSVEDAYLQIDLIAQANREAAEKIYGPADPSV